ncbi:Hypothetical Protein FCC1311_062232 [Hondaea fermentalgiana]|uniref:Uncharacterized protein n=1 Tax=Hondaea fermentalgiana TaxID=2315210 RepID=A0A2R5GN03_9STRA|nr:Hypothetical Protein FCC1311_062232 [Hondaea fermentalgiana]|eukprot:GBG30003.1 Hypothetical Protein FCC1311_062232 [Hondaea fermentalgiana]
MTSMGVHDSSRTTMPAKTPVKQLSPREASRKTKAATRSPSDEVSSPFSKLLLGVADRKAAHKEIARVLFTNGVRRQAAAADKEASANHAVKTSRATPVKSSSLAARRSFLPYRSPTDAMVSPATRGVRSRGARPVHADAENDAPPPFMLPKQQTRGFDLQRSFHMLASGANARNNKLRKLSRAGTSSALGAPPKLGRQRSGNDHSAAPTSTI